MSTRTHQRRDHPGSGRRGVRRLGCSCRPPGGLPEGVLKFPLYHSDFTAKPPISPEIAAVIAVARPILSRTYAVGCSSSATRRRTCSTSSTGPWLRRRPSPYRSAQRLGIATAGLFFQAARKQSRRADGAGDGAAMYRRAGPHRDDNRTASDAGPPQAHIDRRARLGPRSAPRVKPAIGNPGSPGAAPTGLAPPTGQRRRRSRSARADRAASRSGSMATSPCSTPRAWTCDSARATCTVIASAAGQGSWGTKPSASCRSMPPHHSKTRNSAPDFSHVMDLRQVGVREAARMRASRRNRAHSPGSAMASVRRALMATGRPIRSCVAR